MDIGQIIYPPLISAPKSLEIQGFFGPKALHPGPVTAHSVPDFPALFLTGAILTVERPIAPGQEQRTADGTAFPQPRLSQNFRPQFPVSRENGGTDVPAQQRVGDQLRTGAGVASILQ